MRYYNIINYKGVEYNTRDKKSYESLIERIWESTKNMDARFFLKQFIVAEWTCKGLRGYGKHQLEIETIYI